MTFLMMLYVILLSMLTILLSALNVTSHLICCNNQNWNLNLIYETLDWGRNWIVGFNAEKTQLLSFDRSNNTGATDVKWMGLFLRKNHLLKMLGLTFSSKVDWGSYIISIAKTASEKIGAFISSMKFLLLRLFSIYKSAIRSWMEYCCHVWAGGSSSCKNRYAVLLVPNLLPLLNSLAHRRNAASLWMLTGKKHPKIKLQQLRKIRMLLFGSLVHQINCF